MNERMSFRLKQKCHPPKLKKYSLNSVESIAVRLEKFRQQSNDRGATYMKKQVLRQQSGQQKHA